MVLEAVRSFVNFKTTYVVVWTREPAMEDHALVSDVALQDQDQTV